MVIRGQWLKTTKPKAFLLILARCLNKVKLKFGGHSLAIGLSLDIDFAFYFKYILCEKKDFNIYKNIYKPDFIIKPEDDIPNIKKIITENNNKQIFNAIKFRFDEKYINLIQDNIDVIFTLDKVFKDSIQILINDIRISKNI